LGEKGAYKHIELMRDKDYYTFSKTQSPKGLTNG